MSTDFVSKSYHVNVIAFTAFDRRTGVASNIDAVITACDAENVKYAGGDLTVAGSGVGSGDEVGKDGDGLPVKKNPTDTRFTEE